MRDGPKEVLAIFTAALNGYCASFAGGNVDPIPENAVAFARKCVRAAFDNKDWLELPNLIFDPEPPSNVDRSNDAGNTAVSMNQTSADSLKQSGEV